MSKVLLFRALFLTTFFASGSIAIAEAPEPIRIETQSPESDEAFEPEWGVHAQFGVLSPVGLAGAYVSASPARRWTLMAGGGYALPDVITPSWRVGFGVAGHFLMSGRHALSAELWVALGPWSGLGDPGLNPDEVVGEWNVMLTSYLHLAYSVRVFEHVQLRLFLGLATNFGVEPSNACNIYCEGPLIVPSMGVALGYLL